MIEAVIPTVGATMQLFELLEVLVADGIRTTVYDNGAPADFRAGLEAAAKHGFELFDATGMGLYLMWDFAVISSPSDYVAVLNDDISILPGTLAAMASTLDGDPELDLVCADYHRRCADGFGPLRVEYTKGTYRDGGVCGWCFVVRRSTYPGIDGDYRWWCGDDELVARITRKNNRKVAILRGAPVDHIGEASASQADWTHEAKALDMVLFNKRWGS